mmetsp:Transcript_54009/g.124344  ORF Transcript_54009/g.124344 Transcript_54009/m.124344 type:complete len:151 (-) Transcript_54009:303-755(-)
MAFQGRRKCSAVAAHTTNTHSTHHARTHARRHRTRYTRRRTCPSCVYSKAMLMDDAPSKMEQLPTPNMHVVVAGHACTSDDGSNRWTLRKAPIVQRSSAAQTAKICRRAIKMDHSELESLRMIILLAAADKSRRLAGPDANIGVHALNYS